MKRILNSLFALAALAVLVTTTSKQSLGADRDEDGCSAATLRGNYGFTFNGFAKDDKGRNVPFAGAGLFMFDGAGNASANFADSFNGATSTNNTYTATYAVNSDCTALMTATHGSGDNAFLVIIRGEHHEDDESTSRKREATPASEILGIDISTGATWTIDLKKQ